ncbi:RagB/SusD family nutrient uptake outer membrane protein [Chitinophaga arvensicola]|uniref:Starch-binding associating with outer membrane n=1 Tax=Chitinophaga arvensicola TaxID=29529 RepID=A0A1I0S9I7_9BACT|nr:RagB/SusD family nutrient uptake outer membrane protein [Chitinophaga arvensicola]SEW52843.1 Starch-binding associating with outer membrane [Chitinophaga arvensicola]
MNRFFSYKNSIPAFAIGIAMAVSGLMSCTKVLDKPDLGAIPSGEVWTDLNLSTAFLNNIYLNVLPNWPDATYHVSDEGSGGGDVLFGQLTVNSINYWPYADIRSINLLLQQVPAAPFTESDKNTLVGQALFLRAWLYFQMVSRYGGVPIILTPQNLEDNLNVSRNKTSECIAQIVKDLDNAVALLPTSWNADNAGRITRGAALAFKGRVLLHYASEQFNPTQDPSRWQTAYNANKAAMDSLTKYGNALMPDFRNLWFVEGIGNTEAIMVTRFSYPGRPQTHDASIRPLEESQNYTGGDQPSLELVNAFPMKNGLPVTTPGSGYNSQAYWLNRDPRFATTVVHNGDAWALSGKTGRIQWTFSGGEAIGGTFSGFYTRKTVFEGYKPFDAEHSGTDWIEIRLAEVMLNYAETANETGNVQTGYDMITAIRKRAGIDAGTDGHYGLKANMSKEEMRAAILTERRLELAFEGKRDQDLRRRRLYASVLNGKKRTGLDIRLIKFGGKAGDFFAAYATGTINLNTDYFSYFSETPKLLDPNNVINYKDEYYFYAIPQDHLQKNPNLQQTKGWDGGTFDPLQ